MYNGIVRNSKHNRPQGMIFFRHILFIAFLNSFVLIVYWLKLSTLSLIHNNSFIRNENINFNRFNYYHVSVQFLVHSIAMSWTFNAKTILIWRKIYMKRVKNEFRTDYKNRTLHWSSGHNCNCALLSTKLKCLSQRIRWRQIWLCLNHWLFF